MAKKSKNPLIIVGAIVVLVVVGVAVYIQQKDDSTNNNQPTTRNCETFEGKEYCTDDYIGLSDDEAISKAQNVGLTARVVESDENPNIISTSDRQDKRINFTIEDGTVTKAEFY